ncbi:MAG: PAS domain S-box protein [Acidobacteriota bacterium]
MTEPAPPALGPIRVLVVGDAASTRAFAAELRGGGYDAECANFDDRAGLERALETSLWDIVLSQDALPGFDGPTILRLIRRIRPGLPVIVVSHEFGESIARAAMKAGAEDFIARGYLARLCAAVDRGVRTARLRQVWEDAARSLSDAEARNAAFMNNSPAVAFMKDDAGRLVYANRTFETVFGVRLEDLLGKTDAEWLPPGPAAEVAANDARVIASGKTMQFEERVPAPDGDHQWLVFKFPFHDATGRTFVGGVALDISERKATEEALRHSEDLYRDLVEHSHVLVCVHDLDGRLLAVNGAAEKNLGYDPPFHPDGDTRRIQDILAPESRAGFDAYLDLVRRTGVASGTMTVMTQTGERRYWEYRNTLRTVGVPFPVVRGIAFDVTDRIRAERELRETRQFAEEIIASAGEGVVVLGTDLRYVLWNRFMEELTGISQEQVLGRSPLEVSPAVREIGVWVLIQKALLGEKVSAHGLPYTFVGSRRPGWASATFSPHRDPDGNIVGVIGIVQDATESKQAEERLRESRAFLEKAQEVGHIGSWISEPTDGGTLVWSRETCRIFGIEPDSFDGRIESFFARVHPEDLESVRAASLKALESGEAYSIDHRIVRPDGTIRWVHERADVLPDAAGRSGRMVGIVQDITERTRLQERFLHSQKMEAVGRLAGGVAHDFNNLLTVILGYVDLLLSQVSEADPMRGDLEEVQKAGERAASLTRQLLALSRQQMLEPKVIDVNAVVENLEKMLRRLLGEDIELVTRLLPGGVRIRADPGQLEQVILNLAVNARDAMPAGGTITMATSSAALDIPRELGRYAVRPGEYAVLEVQDTGTGMDASTRDRIFEPFFTTKEKGKGTGLGLATAYGIVKQSGGYILCDTEPAKGTRFEIFLPRTLDEKAAPARPSQSLRDFPRATETILLVEDEDGVRELSRKLLEALGYVVLEASGGKKAIEIAERYPDTIHVLLTDVVMPGLNGLDLSARILAIRPAIVVLYMSGYPDPAAADLGKLAPFLRKPFTPEGLATRLRDLLAG